MKKDSVKNDAIKKDSVKKDSVKKDSVKKDSVKIHGLLISNLYDFKKPEKSLNNFFWQDTIFADVKELWHLA